MARWGRRRVVLNVGLVLLLVAGGVGIWFFVLRADEPATAAAPRTTAVQQGTVTKTVSAAGNLEPAKQTAINFATSGTISAVNIQVGQKVAEGAVLGRLKSADAEQALDLASAELDSAEAGRTEAYANKEAWEDAEEEAETATPAPAEQSGGQTQSEESLDAAIAQAEAQVESAKQQVEQAQAAVDNCTLIAPVTGTVVTLNGVPGQNVNGGSGSSGSSGAAASSETTTANTSDFVVIANLAAFNVRASYTEADIVDVKVGQAATIVPNASPDTELTAKVTQIDPTSTVINNVVTYGVTLQVTSKNVALRAGQTVSARVTVAEAKDALYLPSTSVQGTGDQTRVTVVRGGVQTPTTVQVGLRGDQTTQILSGLELGDQVVMVGATGTGTGTGTGTRPGGGAGFPGGGGAGGFPAGGGGGGGRP
ncbi:efflux RND transporter periplasmic adaptor subunit [Tenggerimyces flavus]|uniref:Efflux RND transporter periplasmic adaptor subunit n=1 Tax=Tenggerimyces flavus TaxID=1708749 RepID=A0ABV7YA78_9ACTN|nr:biotin/lipoyl-binding protein [Tenggerimyces flavus]MBM7783550.1 macrolide-specific efflux system membrane fusion protein [Tenggerimyces flavus]